MESALSAGSSLACLEYEGFAVEDVELATHKLNGLTQHRVGLVVTVRLQQCGHDVHKSTTGTGYTDIFHSCLKLYNTLYVDILARVKFNIFN